MIELPATIASFLPRGQGLVSSVVQYFFVKKIDRRHQDHLRFRDLHASYRNVHLTLELELQAGQPLDEWPPNFQEILLAMSAISRSRRLRWHIRRLRVSKDLSRGELAKRMDIVLRLSEREFRR